MTSASFELAWIAQQGINWLITFSTWLVTVIITEQIIFLQSWWTVVHWMRLLTWSIYWDSSSLQTSSLTCIYSPLLKLLEKRVSSLYYWRRYWIPSIKLYLYKSHSRTEQKWIIDSISDLGVVINVWQHERTNEITSTIGEVKEKIVYINNNYY